jgi:hypothetical protein
MVKLDKRYGPHRVAKIRKCVPHGKITMVELPKFDGRVLEPMTWASLGLKPPVPPAERRAA